MSAIARTGWRMKLGGAERRPLPTRHITPRAMSFRAPTRNPSGKVT
ncbi:MAG: hypothetical protein ACYC0V_07605 [Armatimonadota bacterium]